MLWIFPRSTHSHRGGVTLGKTLQESYKVFQCDGEIIDVEGLRVCTAHVISSPRI